MKWLDPMVGASIHLYETVKLFSKLLIPFYIHIDNKQSSTHSTFSPTRDSFLNFSCPRGFVMYIMVLSLSSLMLTDIWQVFKLQNIQTKLQYRKQINCRWGQSRGWDYQESQKTLRSGRDISNLYCNDGFISIHMSKFT